MSQAVIRKTKRNRLAFRLLIILGLITLIVISSLAQAPTQGASAAAILTITPITWDVVGLNSQNLASGLKEFPVGGRVCNTGDAQAILVQASLVWDSANVFIYTQGTDTLSIPTLDPNQCNDFYFTINVVADLSVFNTARQYHIQASAQGISPITTPASRQIYVENLTAQTNNQLGAITGPTTVFVGQTYQYFIQNPSIPVFQQLEHFVNFPNNIFRISSVSATYTNPAGQTNTAVYANACGWDSNPTSQTYRQCIGPNQPGYPNGVVGSGLTLIYTVQVIAEGQSTVNQFIYGYADGVYSYQVAPAGTSLTITAISPGSVTNTATATETPSATATQTATATASPTITGTPFTPTPTASATASITLTPTHTVTGTPPTPTATGTIAPTINMQKTVSPSQATVGHLLTFVITISNSGTAPATDAIMTDTFPSVLNITAVSTTRGTWTVNATTRTVTVLLGTMNPNTSATISIQTTVNSTATTSTNQTNTAILNYKVGTLAQSRSSNSVVYRVVGSTLPPTGGYQSDQNTPSYYWPIVAIGAILVLAGIACFIYGVLAGSHKNNWANWFRKTGVLLAVAGMLFTASAWGLKSLSGQESTADQNAPLALSNPTKPVFVPNGDVSWILLPTPTVPEKLPDFPIPTPSVVPEQGPNGQPVDSSAVERILIPVLGVDSVVKFVPYDGLSWQIAGLKQEVAWMGDTSWPGLGGNTGFAGHVTLVDGSNGPFRFLADLQAGDQITLYTQENIYTYMVRGQIVVDDADFSVLQKSEKSQITLITCTNWDKNLKLYLDRLVVFADLQDVKPIAPGAQ